MNSPPLGRSWAISSSQEFYPTYYLIRLQYLVDQRQSIDDLTNRGVLSRVNDAMVLGACRKTEKISILSEYYTSYFSRQLHMFFI